MHSTKEFDDFLLVIPARYKSSRFPGKPLADIHGKTMLVRVWERCVKAAGLDKVVVATDNLLIYDHCKENSIEVMMTSPVHKTGTDRVAEVALGTEVKTLINVQGDEPLINPVDILEIIFASTKWPTRVINGMCAIGEEGEYNDNNVPKVVTSPDGTLLYMSRAPIPATKTNEFKGAMKQVCIYAFPKAVLLDYARRKEKTPLESVEDIEILRFVELGHVVQMVKLSEGSIAIDTPDDLERVRNIVASRAD